jgi:hypothetical protein
MWHICGSKRPKPNGQAVTCPFTLVAEGGFGLRWTASVARMEWCSGGGYFEKSSFISVSLAISM